jgi:DNA recombination protein RmuC
MDSQIFLLILVNILGLAAVAFFILGQLKKQQPAQDDEAQRQMLKGLVNEVFGEVTGKVAEQSKRVLQGEKDIISADLKNKHAAIEKIVEELRHEIEERQRDIHHSEQERNKQFAEISTRIKEHQEITKELKENTAQLKNVLSNNQTRGQWGEHILDGLLRSGGLVENVHYTKQSTLGSETSKPDITLLLPNQRIVAVDAKFPYSAVQKMADETTKEGKLAAKKQFITDVKEKVNQIVKRGYINAEQGTLDYAILFVPNELLFSFINQTAPEVIEYAMEKHVMMVSPFTFLIVTRTIMESYRNFMMENHLRDIVRYIGEFVEEWSRFEGEFGKFDESLTKLRKSYDQITTTRYNRMRLRMNRIEEYRLGQGAQPLIVEEKESLAKLPDSLL